MWPAFSFAMMEPMIQTARADLLLYTEDEKAAFIAMMSDTKVMKFVGNGPLSAADAEKLWEKLTLDFYPKGIETIWAVHSRDDGRYMGHASLRPRQDHPDEWEIGYILKESEWGTGLATEIARALVEYGFDLGFNDVYATVDDDHAASIRVLGKAGFCFLRHDYDESGRYSVFSVSRPRE